MAVRFSVTLHEGRPTCHIHIAAVTKIRKCSSDSGKWAHQCCTFTQRRQLIFEPCDSLTTVYDELNLSHTISRTKSRY